MTRLRGPRLPRHPTQPPYWGMGAPHRFRPGSLRSRPGSCQICGPCRQLRPPRRPLSELQRSRGLGCLPLVQLLTRPAGGRWVPGAMALSCQVFGRLLRASICRVAGRIPLALPVLQGAQGRVGLPRLPVNHSLLSLGGPRTGTQQVRWLYLDALSDDGLKPLENAGGPPSWMNQGTGNKKSLEAAKLLDKMLSDLERRREMNRKAVLKTALPGGSRGSLAASAAGREAMPSTVTGDESGGMALPAAGMEDVLEPMGASADMDQKSFRKAAHPGGRNVPVLATDTGSEEMPDSATEDVTEAGIYGPDPVRLPRIVCPQDARRKCMIGTVVIVFTVPLVLIGCYLGIRKLYEIRRALYRYLV